MNIPLPHRYTWTVPEALRYLCSFVIIMSAMNFYHELYCASEINRVTYLKIEFQILFLVNIEPKVEVILNIFTYMGKEVHLVNLYDQPIPEKRHQNMFTDYALTYSRNCRVLTNKCHINNNIISSKE